jgi:phage repressor protein C with HTH and peptisase S24 domain
MYKASDILRLFEQRMAELGMTQVELGLKAFGKADNSAIQGLKRGSIPALDRVAAMADALDWEVYLGPRREVEPQTTVSIDCSDYVNIPLHEASLSAGPGVENHGQNLICSLAFRRDWLARIGVNAGKACLARVHGDSMLPTLVSGDMVLIDTSRTLPPVRARNPSDKRRSQIFAFVENGEARIKRIDRPDKDTLLLLSDNPDYPPQVRTGDQISALQLSIIGKVVWSGHTFIE